MIDLAAPARLNAAVDVRRARHSVARMGGPWRVDGRGAGYPSGVRALIAALAVFALAAAPARAEYRRVAQVAPRAEAALALAGNELYVGTTLPGVSSTVTAYGTRGGKREV